MIANRLNRAFLGNIRHLSMQQHFEGILIDGIFSNGQSALNRNSQRDANGHFMNRHGETQRTLVICNIGFEPTHMHIVLPDRSNATEHDCPIAMSRNSIGSTRNRSNDEAAAIAIATNSPIKCHSRISHMRMMSVSNGPVIFTQRERAIRPWENQYTQGRWIIQTINSSSRLQSLQWHNTASLGEHRNTLKRAPHL